MRLDHLLSKEHLEASAFQACQISGIRPLLAAHGWNIDIGARLNGSDLVRPLRWVGTVGAGRSGTCTLLGPEGPDDPAPFSGVGVMVSSGLHRDRDDRWVWGFWPSVENYIVDASILETGLRSCFTIGESPGCALSGVRVWRIHWSISHPGLRVRVCDSNSCDFKFLRANGGCLGIWSRRRTS